MDSTTKERFLSRVDRQGIDDCWEWTGGRWTNGYGYLIQAGKSLRAHRVAVELATGVPVPAHLEVCHRCDNPPCCNPSHLWVGTAAENAADREQKGRGRWRHPITPVMIARMVKLRSSGLMYREVADEVGVSITTVYRNAQTPRFIKTHCVHGHPRTPENVNGSSGCVTCGRLRARDYQRRRRAALVAGKPWPPR